MASSVTIRSQRLAGPAAGFTLLGLIIAIAVMNIFLGVVVTRWTFVNQRDREIELIWRGEQYSRAIQCFIEKRGAPPMELEELLEEHCIRRLYTDPMSASGEWRILTSADLGEEFAELAASLAGADDPVGFEPEPGNDLGGEDIMGVGSGMEPSGDPGGLGSGSRRSSVLDRMRNARSKSGAQAEQRFGSQGFGSRGSRFGRGGSDSGLGGGSRQGLGGSSSGLGSGAGLDAGGAGSQLGSSLGGSGEPSVDDPNVAPEGTETGRKSLRERAEGRLASRLAERNLTGRGRNDTAIFNGVLGIVTSGSGESIRTYKDTNRYEEWYFTLGSTAPPADGPGGLEPQLPGQETPPPTDTGRPGIGGSNEERKSRFRRPSLRRGG